MAKMKSSIPADAWSHSEGQRGATIRVAEDWQRGGAVYLNRTVDRKPVRKALGEYLGHDEPYMLRNARGEILEMRRRRAIEAAQECVAEIAAGRDPFRATKPTGVIAASGLVAEKKPTIKDLFDFTLRGSRGIYVAHTEQKSARLGASEHVIAALGSNFLCEEVNDVTCETVWRHLLAQAKHADDLIRTAERAVQTLYHSLNWAPKRDRRFTHRAAAFHGWGQQMRDEWQQKFGQKPGKKEQPRFSEEESALIYQKIATADPRVRTMLEAAPDQRAGQAVRARRSDLDLTDGAGELGYGELNLEPHELGQKWTTTLSLSEEARDEFLRAMGPRGYLYELEAAYQRHLRGEQDGVQDYHLWPAGRLNGEGVVRLRAYLAPRKQKRGGVRTEPAHMTSDHLIVLLHKHTDSIGITRVKDRGWYGLRRVMSDLAEDVETDARALREITGWQDDATRRKYQKKRNPKARRKAAIARGKIRLRLVGGVAKGAADGQEPGVAAAPVDLSTLSTEQLLALATAIQARLNPTGGNDD